MNGVHNNETYDMNGYIKTSDGVKLNFTIRKTGKKPLLWLHGWGGNQVSFTRAIEALTGDYTIISYDHRGFGESDKPDDPVYSVERLAKDLHEVIISLDLRDVVLVGWSMGGVVAAEYLDIYGKDRVSKLVLIDVNSRLCQDENDLLRDIGLIAKGFRYYAEEMPEKCNMSFATESEKLAFIEKATEQNKKPYPLIALLLAISNTDLTEIYKRLDIPVLFCHGANSTFCSQEDCMHMLDILPAATLVEFPHCSHFIPIERPLQFAAAVDKFVSQ
jgi:pimeloyl-ACP methyl ester carboxylesterase